MSIDNKIKELGFELPNAADPVGSYVATKIAGKLLYISGQISIDKDGKNIKGKIGRDLTVEDGYKAAERCALSIVSQVKKACENDLSKIKEESFGIREIIKNNSESIIRFKTTDFSSNIDINTSEDYELFHNRFFNV